jgi:hypothetical protein
MTTETAQTVLTVITAVGFVVWLAGLAFLLTSARVGRPATTDDLGEAWPQGWLTGWAEVSGRPEDLVQRATSLLVKEGSVKILERTDDRVAFERVGQVPAGGWGGRGELRFMPLGRDRTRVEYGVEREGPRLLLRLAGVFQALGLVALLVGPWLVYTMLVSSPNPAVRGQALQMAQVVHLLWPPFLFAGLYRRGVHNTRAAFDTLTHNLPYQ